MENGFTAKPVELRNVSGRGKRSKWTSCPRSGMPDGWQGNLRTEDGGGRTSAKKRAEK
jgi:hypothetical protein